MASHKLLIDANVFNISLLLPPSLSFLQRLKDIVPPDSDIAISTLTSFLDDFLVNVFHPQLEETVTELCTQSFMELGAFQRDARWSQYASRPVFKVIIPIIILSQLMESFVGHMYIHQTHTSLLQTVGHNTSGPSL